MGFFDRKLPTLMKKFVGLALSEVNVRTATFRDGLPFSIEQFSEHFVDVLRSATTKLPAYSTSFCYTEPEDHVNGLLSQWRGYGRDGGYAIVFDTAALDILLREDASKYRGDFCQWGDVEYFDESFGGNRHFETEQWEKSIQKTVLKMLQRANPEPFIEELFPPIVSLALHHKHYGFREEAEVRIVTMPAQEALLDSTSPRLSREIKFHLKNGTLVPYLELFKGTASKFPIVEIVVGPHPDKLKRADSARRLLENLGLIAAVRVSDIPYLCN